MQAQGSPGLPLPLARSPQRPLARAAAGAVLAALLASCSTAPRPSEMVIATRNKAAEAAQIGNSWFHQGRYDLALRYFTEALQYNASIDNRDGVIRSTNSIGRVDMALGDMDEAERLFARAAAQAAGASQELVVLSRTNAGELLLARGRPEEALAVFEELLALPAGGAGAMTDEQRAILLHDRGSARRDRGDYEAARQDLSRSLSLNIAAKRSEAAAADYYMLASVDARQDDLQSAAANLQLALALDKKVENSPGIAKDLYALGVVSRRRGDPAAALDYFDRAYAVSTTLSIRADMRKALAGLIESSEALGRTAEAAEYRAALDALGPSQ
jgi:tetratricopeptide (TPR) repeat protein